jgi:hypothetical protein
MAQTGFTPIQLYSSSTATNVPLAANLATGELAINITDGKLFYKDNAAAVQVIGWKVVPATAGGTGQTSYAVGDLLYANTTTTLAKLADVATGNALISGGVSTAPSWGKIGLTTHVSGTLPTANGGTNLTSFTSGGVVYASSTSALTTGSVLTYASNSFNIGSVGTVQQLLGGMQNTNWRIREKSAVDWCAWTTNQNDSGVQDDAGKSSWMTQQGYGGGNDYWRIARAPAGSSTFAEFVKVDASGNFFVGYFSGSNHYIAKAVAEGSDILGVLSTTTNLQTAYFMGVSSAGENGAASAIGVRKNSSTSRSINAAGTINASGADYAEYMTKAGDFTIAKGDVVGINAQGKLTNVFADAVSFVVKSTDPSYVGGDVWGNEEALGLTKPQVPAKREPTEEVEAETDEEFAVRQTQYEANKVVFDAALEAARQRVDRIAFAGQVPVNVTGAAAGQYIIPINDNGAIKGEAVSNPTFEQYQIAVGKVIALEPDGRAKIIVKVA